MTDDLDRLNAALKSTPPTPDAARKGADIAAALSAFDQEFSAATQETSVEARPSDSRPHWVRLIDGGKKMFLKVTTGTGLAITTGLVTAGLAVMIVMPQDIAPPSFPKTSSREASSKDQTGAEPVVASPLSEAPATSLSLNDSPVAPQIEGRAGMVAEMAEADLAAPMALEEAPMAATPSGAMAARKLGDMERAPAPAPALSPQAEEFSNEDASSVKIVAEEPVSTFSADVDTASWSVLRSSILSGFLPPKEAVRIEEMVNYFPYAYPAPEPDGTPFEPSVSVSQTPWNADTRLLKIALQGELPATAERPPLNLVFLIDTSGSMSDANKLPLLKQSLRLMLGELRPEDEVAIVTYAGSAGLVLEPTPASERETILSALDRLEAGGSTAGQAGLEQAYATAASMSGEGEVSRILLATDGDFNVGIHDPQALEDYIAGKRDEGAFLSVLGFGRGNLDDATMQALAQTGNGQAAYIDTIAEAQKVLVDQLTGQLFPIAQDVKIQLEFNPAEIAEYRLIGYETRALRREDFSNDKVDAGEIGAGHQVTALYEVTPVGSPAILNEPLRYQTAADATGGEGELGFLRLRYKEPGGTESRLIELPIPAEVSEASVETRFAAAIAGFGQLLRGSVYTGVWGYADAIALANGARGEDPFGYRAEAVRLMRLAETLSN